MFRTGFVTWWTSFSSSFGSCLVIIFTFSPCSPNIPIITDLLSAIFSSITTPRFFDMKNLVLDENELTAIGYSEENTAFATDTLVTDPLIIFQSFFNFRTGKILIKYCRFVRILSVVRMALKIILNVIGHLRSFGVIWGHMGSFFLGHFLKIIWKWD